MNQERLLKILLAPHVSEKSNRVAERLQPGGIQGDLAMPPNRKSGMRWSCCSRSRSRASRSLNVKGKRKRFGSTFGRAFGLEESLRFLGSRQ
jgi:large subunit ribosomal protein L23